MSCFSATLAPAPEFSVAVSPQTAHGEALQGDGEGMEVQRQMLLRRVEARHFESSACRRK